MTWCLRISPLVAAAILALRARWLIGLFSGSGAGGATTSSSSLNLSSALSLLGGAGALVSQFFAWLFVLLGACLVWGLLSLVVGEISLRREFRRPPRRRRAK